MGTKRPVARSRERWWVNLKELPINRKYGRCRPLGYLDRSKGNHGLPGRRKYWYPAAATVDNMYKNAATADILIAQYLTHFLYSTSLSPALSS